MPRGIVADVPRSEVGEGETRGAGGALVVATDTERARAVLRRRIPYFCDRGDARGAPRDTTEGTCRAAAPKWQLLADFEAAKASRTAGLTTRVRDAAAAEARAFEEDLPPHAYLAVQDAEVQRMHAVLEDLHAAQQRPFIENAPRSRGGEHTPAAPAVHPHALAPRAAAAGATPTSVVSPEAPGPGTPVSDGSSTVSPPDVALRLDDAETERVFTTAPAGGTAIAEANGVRSIDLVAPIEAWSSGTVTADPLFASSHASRAPPSSVAPHTAGGAPVQRPHTATTAAPSMFDQLPSAPSCTPQPTLSGGGNSATPLPSATTYPSTGEGSHHPQRARSGVITAPNTPYVCYQAPHVTLTGSALHGAGGAGTAAGDGGGDQTHHEANTRGTAAQPAPRGISRRGSSVRFAESVSVSRYIVADPTSGTASVATADALTQASEAGSVGGESRVLHPVYTGLRTPGYSAGREGVAGVDGVSAVAVASAPMRNEAEAPKNMPSRATSAGSFWRAPRRSLLASHLPRSGVPTPPPPGSPPAPSAITEHTTALPPYPPGASAVTAVPGLYGGSPPHPQQPAGVRSGAAPAPAALPLAISPSAVSAVTLQSEALTRAPSAAATLMTMTTPPPSRAIRVASLRPPRGSTASLPVAADSYATTLGDAVVTTADPYAATPMPSFACTSAPPSHAIRVDMGTTTTAPGQYASPTGLRDRDRDRDTFSTPSTTPPPSVGPHGASVLALSMPSAVPPPCHVDHQRPETFAVL